MSPLTKLYLTCPWKKVFLIRRLTFRSRSPCGKKTLRRGRRRSSTGLGRSPSSPGKVPPDGGVSVCDAAGAGGAVGEGVGDGGTVGCGLAAGGGCAPLEEAPKARSETKTASARGRRGTSEDGMVGILARTRPRSGVRLLSDQGGISD